MHDFVDSPTSPPRWITVCDGLAQLQSRAFDLWCRKRGIDPRDVDADVDALSDRRPKISRAVRLQVIERDGLVCQICFLSVDRADVHLDHVIQFAHGGSSVAANLRVTHSRCNLRRSRR